MGFDLDQFTDLSEREASYLRCPICDKVLESPISNKCGHLYCEPCLRQRLQSTDQSLRTCPVDTCRQALGRTEQSQLVDLDENTVVVERLLFSRIPAITGQVMSLNIHCQYTWNGCHAVVRMSSLAEHMDQCEHKLCQRCELVATGEAHDCVQALKEDNAKWKSLYQKIVKEHDQTMTDNMKLSPFYSNYESKDSVKKIKNEKCWTNGWEVNELFFGTFKANAGRMSIDDSGLVLNAVSDSQVYHSVINLGFSQMSKMMFCNDPKLSAIVCLPRSQLCRKLNQELRIDNFSFNNKSENPKDTYIIITLKTSIEASVGYLIRRSKEVNSSIKMTTISLIVFSKLLKRARLEDE